MLEIGPGPGTLTELLAEVAGQVIAVELDAGMVNLLRQEYAHLTNLSVIEADILKTDLATLLPNAPDGYKVVANLPYYITSAVIRHLLEAIPQPQRLVVLVQKEVAQRMTAPPGQMSLLAVSVQFYGEAQIVHHIPAGAFYPAPKVDSAVVRIDTYADQPLPLSEITPRTFFRIVKAGFSQKRKQLKNTLAAGLHRPKAEIAHALTEAGINPQRRAESLSMAEWAQLVNRLS